MNIRSILINYISGFTPYKPKTSPIVTSADRQANARLFQRCHEMKNLELLSQMTTYHRYLVLKYESERMRKGNLSRLIPKPGAWQKYKRLNCCYFCRM